MLFAPTQVSYNFNVEVGMVPLTHMRSQRQQVDSKIVYLILRSKRTDYVQ